MRGVERLLLTVAFSTLILPGCTVHPKEQPSTDIDDTLFGDHVRVLASDDFLGRKPGTPGEDKTVAFLVDQFRKMGLKPGNGASYVQQVPLVQIAAGADTTLTAALPAGPRTLVLGKDMLIWTKRAVPEIRVSASELVFVGYGIVAPEYSWNDYAGIDVHGKTVLVLANDPGYASKDPTVFKAGAMTDYGTLSYKMEEAARHGAQGVLVIHDSRSLGFNWNAVQGIWGGALFELPAADSYAGRAAIEGWLQLDAARALFGDAGLDFTRLSTAAGFAGFKAVPMRISIDAAIHNSIRAFNSQNVIAVWPGRHSHEYVMYAAHWDSLGTDPAVHGHNIFNGAVDNATGLAGLLSIAQSFVHTDPKPDRSIAFLATTAAEPDLLGSQYYLENPILPLRQTAGVLNIDRLIDGGRSRDVSILGFGNTDLEDMARAEALLQGRETHAEPNPEFGWYYRSDSYSFARRGVPVLYLQAGVDSAARGPAWGRAHIEDYFAHRYGQLSDQYSPDWNVSGPVTDLMLYYQVGLRAASTRRFPRWYPNSEFRATHRHSSGPASTDSVPTNSPRTD